MFKVSDVVNYSTTGVCEITEITEKEIGAEVKSFYILRPVFDNNATVMVPIENELLTSRMRALLSLKEVSELISKVDEISPLWYNDDRVRFEEYKKALLSNDRAVHLSIIKALILHQKSQHEKGRKLKNIDERILKEAEKILYSEVAFLNNWDIKEMPKKFLEIILK